MLNNALQANATPLPLTMSAAIPTAQHQPEMISCRAGWAASIGRTAADVAALMFRLPMPAHLRALFEDTIRREVAAELLNLPHVSEDEGRQLEDIAWLAFDRRLSRHSTAPRARGLS